jgi:hypothetical protein
MVDLHVHYPMHLLGGVEDPRDVATGMLQVARREDGKLRAAILNLAARLFNFRHWDGTWRVSVPLLQQGGVTVACSVLYRPFSEMDLDEPYSAPPESAYYDRLIEQLKDTERDIEAQGQIVVRSIHDLDRARAEGKTSVGIDSWDLEVPRLFAAHHGFDEKQISVNRRQNLAKIDRAELDRLHQDALAHAASYELVRRVGATPADELDALSRMTAAINDAPLDGLELEDEQFPPERIVAYETAQAARGHVLHRVYARHRETGELAGQTVVAVEGDRPWIANQHDTSVVRAHRGHRLGVLLKTEMLRWLAEAQPQLETIDTWNAQSNDHMIGVNEALGYEILGRSVAYQRSL